MGGDVAGLYGALLRSGWLWYGYRSTMWSLRTAEEGTLVSGLGFFQLGLGLGFLESAGPSWARALSWALSLFVPLGNYRDLSQSSVIVF